TRAFEKSPAITLTCQRDKTRIIMSPLPAYQSTLLMNLAPGIEIKASQIDGLGCFATTCFQPGQKIAEYVGERITADEAERRVRGRRRVYICAVDEETCIDG